MRRILAHLSMGNPARLMEPAIKATLANLVNLVPFVILLRVVAHLVDAITGGSAGFDWHFLWSAWLSMCAWALVMFLAGRAAYRSEFLSAYEVSADGRTALAEHIRKLPLGYFASRDPGDLTNMMVTDFASVEEAISHYAPQLIAASVMPLLAFAGLSFLDWRMALAMFAPLPIALLVLLSSNRLFRILSIRHLAAKADAANRLQEYLSGIKVMKAHSLLGARFSRLELSFRHLMRESVRIEAISGPLVLSAIACMRAGLPLMIVVGAPLLAGGSLSVVDFVTFLIIGTRVYDPLSAAMIWYALLRYSELAGERILSLMREPVQEGGEIPARGAAARIAFENVSFAYGEEPVLNDVSISFEPGELTALVGPSGGGKSTLTKLAARFYDPVSGRVTFRGRDARTLAPEALLKNVSIVFQDVYLFQDTVVSNIRYGKMDATDEEVRSAAEAACCAEFIEQLPQGYDTMIGEGGCTLSGGEKQRISIARALLKNAPVVLLDEATASLDPENERSVQKAIDSLTEGRTVVVIAHKLKTIAGADKIIVVDRGIVEQGRHEELLEKEGLYAHLWKIQQEASAWSV